MFVPVRGFCFVTFVCSFRSVYAPGEADAEPSPHYLGETVCSPTGPGAAPSGGGHLHEHGLELLYSTDALSLTPSAFPSGGILGDVPGLVGGIGRARGC